MDAACVILLCCLPLFLQASWTASAALFQDVRYTSPAGSYDVEVPRVEWFDSTRASGAGEDLLSQNGARSFSTHHLFSRPGGYMKATSTSAGIGRVLATSLCTCNTWAVMRRWLPLE